MAAEPPLNPGFTLGSGGIAPRPTFRRVQKALPKWRVWISMAGGRGRNNAEGIREMKPHVKLAYLLIVAGMGIFMLERYGLGTLTQNGDKPHLDGFLLGALALAPIVLIVAGCLVFAVGSMRRSR